MNQLTSSRHLAWQPMCRCMNGWMWCVKDECWIRKALYQRLFLTIHPQMCYTYTHTHTHSAQLWPCDPLMISGSTTCTISLTSMERILNWLAMKMETMTTITTATTGEAHINSHCIIVTHWPALTLLNCPAITSFTRPVHVSCDNIHRQFSLLVLKKILSVISCFHCKIYHMNIVF